MSIEELIIYGKKYIHSDLAKLLLSSLLNMNALELINNLDLEVDENIVKTYKNYVARAQKKEPIQYIIGNVDFYGYVMDIDSRVLIPRFETEGLVELAIKYLKNYEKPSIIDIGTGSGCIAIALKKELNCDVTAVDISLDALEVAKKNIEKHNVDIKLLQSDIFENVEGTYDLIISNPPYIAYDEKIMDIVKDNEPNNALYADDNGLYYYKEIIKNSKNHLNEKGIIAFEIGSSQADSIKAFTKIYYPDAKIIVKKDLNDFDRYLIILT